MEWLTTSSRCVGGASCDMLYCIFYQLVRAAFSLWFKIVPVGIDRLPSDGPLILVANHRSGFDPPMVAAVVRRPVYFMAKFELFRIAPFAWLIRRLHAYPVRRGKPDRASIRRSLELLKTGQILLIFPEGHRSESGLLQEIRGGTVLLAKKARVPVVALGVAGNYGFRRRLVFALGDPFTLPREMDDGEARERIRAEISRQIDRAARALKRG